MMLMLEVAGGVVIGVIVLIGIGALCRHWDEKLTRKKLQKAMQVIAKGIPQMPPKV